MRLGRLDAKLRAQSLFTATATRNSSGENTKGGITAVRSSFQKNGEALGVIQNYPKSISGEPSNSQELQEDTLAKDSCSSTHIQENLSVEGLAYSVGFLASALPYLHALWDCAFSCSSVHLDTPNRCVEGFAPNRVRLRRTGKFKKCIIWAIIAAMVYHIWQANNSTIWRATIPTTQVLINRLKYDVKARTSSILGKRSPVLIGVGSV